ncbi:hypothetical protein PPERSA_06358 [Pseudocohnilembus persalinus]|uniref:Uncharacterized protein n=1 Tax=Pseudocohnilembus persalinus TaxID=266149 RepID=A0A0V0QIM5_PSEPJ|nr:hypothetical protein PPERSA_06358 [Pseudocohnilembus persalinus]|eukprot:KRX02163.1 hypothetical protein PPERSA_06358 [Pseudocohnilembus persalinus]
MKLLQIFVDKIKEIKENKSDNDSDDFFADIQTTDDEQLSPIEVYKRKEEENEIENIEKDGSLKRTISDGLINDNEHQQKKGTFWKNFIFPNSESDISKKQQNKLDSMKFIDPYLHPNKLNEFYDNVLLQQEYLIRNKKDKNKNTHPRISLLKKDYKRYKEIGNTLLIQ